MILALWGDFPVHAVLHCPVGVGLLAYIGQPVV